MTVPCVTKFFVNDPTMTHLAGRSYSASYNWQVYYRDVDLVLLHFKFMWFHENFVNDPYHMFTEFCFNLHVSRKNLISQIDPWTCANQKPNVTRIKFQFKHVQRPTIHDKRFCHAYNNDLYFTQHTDKTFLKIVVPISGSLRDLWSPFLNTMARMCYSSVQVWIVVSYHVILLSIHSYIS